MNGELELWPRQHDLPPRWDGLPVEWGEWSDHPIVCGQWKSEKCTHCGSLRDSRINLGRIWAERTDSLRTINRAPRALVANIAAFRCPDCGHDRVVDGLGPDAQTWDLDPTDYTDDGSWEV